ncbi:hypothetical protein [Ensifer aridi]|uniref:hypothetical protein n=1 Tax=Ensifer aridi TaxID=1708715 RepID=UPI000A0F86CC|nr:hypothetical protein [Ensifer aridi]
MLRLFSAFMVAALAGEASAACNGSLLGVTEWSARPIDERYVEVTVTLQSHAKKPIRMIDAFVAFRDALNGEIGAINLERDAAIPAGGVFTDKGRWYARYFSRLTTLKKEDVKTSTCVNEVLYEDGSKEIF